MTMDHHVVFSTVVALLVSHDAAAHFSFIDVRSQIACNFFADEGLDWLAWPILEGASFDTWWFHGQVGCQDNATGAFELPAGGVVDMVMSSRHQLVPPPWSTGRSFRPADPSHVRTAEEWAADELNTIGGYHNIHAWRREDTSGCALAIAYESDATAVKPTDFVVFSVVHDCPKRQKEPVDVPDLPACPGGVCICAWFWIPKNSGARNFYMTPFVCNVTGARPDASPVDVGDAIPARRCLNPTRCNFGPR